MQALVKSSFYIALICLPAAIIVAVMNIRRYRSSCLVDEEIIEYTREELSALNANELTYPIVPRTITLVGVLSMLAFYGMTALVVLSSIDNIYIRAIISLCISVPLMIVVDYADYVIQLNNDKKIVFVPRTIGLEGWVYEDIPAKQHGSGILRLNIGSMPTQIRAKSNDETILSKQTKVKIIYADDDRTVIVEKTNN